MKLLLKNIILCIGMALPALFFTACQTRITGTLDESGGAVLRMDMSLGTKTALLVRRLSAQSNRNAEVPLLDARQINANLERMNGIEKADLKQKDNQSVQGTVSVKKISALVPANTAQFITWDQSASGGVARITVDRQNGPAILNAVSPNLADYLSTLMAPIATGENLDKKEYLELLGSVYGKNIADEIAAARFKMDLTMPGPALSVSGGTSSGNLASFDTPLVDILVLEKQLVYEIRWGKQ